MLLYSLLKTLAVISLTSKLDENPNGFEFRLPENYLYKISFLLMYLDIIS